MARYNLTTTDGYDFYEMSSLLQKSIRRGDFEKAGFAAYQLIGKFRKYLWKRLLVISAEDCYGIITKEIIGLKLADDETGRDGTIFAAKAITLLCAARKNRDACYFACNFMTDAKTLDPAEIEEPMPIEDCVMEKIPDYVFDVHTLKGKWRGKTIEDMIRDEQDALYPKQIGFFDDEPWDAYLEEYRKGKTKKG